MSRLKTANAKGCLSLLRGYLDQAPSDRNKGMAVLALDQLERVIAGDNVSAVYSTLLCNGKPRAQG